jgi:hypothetical protein
MASAASCSPALRPTRGSGLGGVVDMLPLGAGALPCEEEVGPAQPAVDIRPRASEIANSFAEAIPGSL